MRADGLMSERPAAMRWPQSWSLHSDSTFGFRRAQGLVAVRPPHSSGEPRWMRRCGMTLVALSRMNRLECAASDAAASRRERISCPHSSTSRIGSWRQLSCSMATEDARRVPLQTADTTPLLLLLLRTFAVTFILAVICTDHGVGPCRCRVTSEGGVGLRHCGGSGVLQSACRRQRLPMQTAARRMTSRFNRVDECGWVGVAAWRQHSTAQHRSVRVCRARGMCVYV